MKSTAWVCAGWMALGCAAAVSAENWPRFRGPEGRGHHQDGAIPTTWGAEDILWRVELKGEGQSSPVNWGHRIFLTTALDGGRSRVVMALDARDGRLLWERTIPCDAPERPHMMNSHATATCATDGERVVAFFGPAGLHCFDLDGAPLWSKSFGEFPGPFGVAASPIFFGETVIQNCDMQGESFLVALNRKTGDEVWRTPRAEKPNGGWSTPIVIRAENREELVLNGEFGVDAYDPASGRHLWFCSGFNGRGEPIPDYAHGLLFLLNGKPGDIYAVRPGGSGDVSESRRAWQTPRKKVRDVASPVVVGDFLFAIDMKGSAATYDARKGRVLWSEKVSGAFTASPLVSGGLIYLTAESGEALVIRPGATLDVVARNSLGERPGELFRASSAPIDGKLYFRSTRALYCVGRKN